MRIHIQIYKQTGNTFIYTQRILALLRGHLQSYIHSLVCSKNMWDLSETLVHVLAELLLNFTHCVK